MRTHITFCSGLFLLVGLCGCSKPAQPPATLVQQISQADRIVVTNRYLGVAFTITGDEAGSVGRAVTSAKRDENAYAATFDWDVQFYAGTNFLTVISFQDRAFLAGGTQYSDDTGVLKAFYQKLERRTEAR